MPPKMQINLNRIKSMINTLAKFTDTPEQGVTRFSYSSQDKKARDYLIGVCQEIGLSNVRVDAVGNIIARLNGRDSTLPTIMTGSHIDTVQNGGKFDGIVGCACSLEALRVMVENNYHPLRSIELVFFAEEEGSNFEISLFGSKAMIGKLGVDDIKKMQTPHGETAYDLITNAGFHPENITNDIIKKGDVEAYIELHIEQSVRLHTEGRSIGIVSGLAGIKWFEVIFRGQADHAGATPMHLRRDAMSAASKVISKVEQMARSTSPTTVATVGRIEVFPNVPNIIPSQVRFVVDIRDIKQSGISNVVKKLKELVTLIASESSIDYSIKIISSIPPVELSTSLHKILENNAKMLGADYIFMPSGALHDCNCMAEICSSGMIFVPSINGLSHSPEENTKFDDIKIGADLLLATLIQLADN